MNTTGKKVVFIAGTRPEIIKIYPVVNYFKQTGFTDYLIINTGQHKEMSDPFWNFFDLKPDYNLEVMLAGQSLTSLLNRSLSLLSSLLDQLIAEGVSPEILIAQGDTTTVMASAFAAFYHRRKFFHLEAGLRSFNLQHPYPEELNRKVSSIIASYHYAPTLQAKQNLLNEGVPENLILLSGNTVVDALKLITASDAFKKVSFTDARIHAAIAGGKRIILITCHRRENHDFIGQIIQAIHRLSEKYRDLVFVWPVHANPAVRQNVFNSALAAEANVLLCDPLEYMEVLKLMQHCHKIITDSGGIQEEAPSFNVPVLVLREATERPESLEAGYSVLVGSSTEKIIEAFTNFNPSFASHMSNPYGDGRSAEKIGAHLIEQLRKV